MDLLAFICFGIVIVPLQIMLFMCLGWVRAKFDRYEDLAIEVLKRKNIDTALYDGKYMFSENNKRNADGERGDNSSAAAVRTNPKIVTMLKNKYRGHDALCEVINSASWLDNPTVSLALDLVSNIWLRARR